jgi:diguanylate cyclase (GGDEF)-like protein
LIKRQDSIKKSIQSFFISPIENRTDFLLEVSKHNRNRLKITLPALFILSMLTTLYLYFGMYIQAPDEYVLKVIEMHGFLLIPTLLTYISLILIPKNKATVSKMENLIFKVYLVYCIFWTLFFSLLSQSYSDQITVFQFGIGFVAIIFFLDPLFSLILYGSAILTFALSIGYFQPNPSVVTSDILNSSYMFFIAWVASIILYKNLISDYKLKRKVNDQVLELEQLNKKLEELSIKDSLTGIHNRRFFDKQVTDEWTMALQENSILAIAILDIDDFKNFNDKYGHLEGDDVLKRVVTCIQENSKSPGDVCARFGGEEFVLLLPKTDIMGAQLVCEKIRKDIEELKIPHLISPSGYLTVSIGVCALTPETDENFLNFIKKADEALYEAKTLGKNRVVALTLKEEKK